jgi:lysozyme
MFLKEFFKSPKKSINEGGNVSSQSPGWQGAADQEAEEIDLKIHDRDYMVGQLRTLLAAQNESFKAAYGKPIWDPKLLKSGQMFSGSSLQFFDVKGVNTQDFMNKLKKTKVGDIDTQIDQDMGDEVTAWLKSIIGQKVGNGTFLGFNSSLSSIWLLDDPQVRIQVDYELGPYDPKTKAPTEWFAYSHSSHYDDMAAGIKGVFHKYINRALTHAQASEKYVARVLKKGVKISDAPVTDSDYSFAVSSSQGGGMSIKYKPYIDPATGQPMEKDGIPVMQLLEPKDRDYIQNLDQQFQMTYGRKRTAADQKLQGSFVGTLQLMNKAFTPEQNEAVARAFLDILFGRGSQMITKDDPARDRDVKFAAVDAMLLGGGGVKPLNLANGQGLRQEAVKMAMDYADAFNAKKGGKATLDTEVAEDAAAEIAEKPNYARQGIKHLYNRLPDGRVSSAEMKDADFLEIAKEISNNGGTLDGLPISLKVDGAGIRFGKDQSGRPFFMTSKVTTPLYQDDVGYFTSFGQERGQDPEQLARTKNYDNALALITGSKFIQTLPADTIVQAEMMYNPMAQKTDQGLKFVNIPYDPAKLGGEMTLVPFVFKQYSTGEDRPDADKIKKRLLAASDSKIKIVTNQLQQKGINVSKIINPILDLDPKDKANKPAFDKAKQELSSAIIDNPKLAGKDALGDNMEGIVVNMPNGQMFKVTSSQMKSAMAAKMAQPAAKRQGPLKTAVVAIGSFAGHLGHEDLFNATLNKAKELGGDPYLFIGNAVGEDDPIPTDVKVQTWHKLYPQYANNISTVMQGGSIMQKVKHELINPQPGKPPKYDNVVIMVGEDRANMPLAGALMKAVTKFPGYEHVKVTLETIPRTRPISFTKLRDVLKNPNATPEQQYTVWAQGFNEKKLGKDWILNLMDVSRKGMGVTEPDAQPIAPLPAAKQTPQPVVEVRLFNTLIRPKLILENNVSKIAAMNNIKDVNKIQAGQQLKLPDGTIYTVAKGDTLSGIAAGQFKGIGPSSTQGSAGSGRGGRGGPTAQELSTLYPSKTNPVAPIAKKEPEVPANAVRSTDGAPVKTGSGGNVVSGTLAPDPKAVAAAKAKLTPSQLDWLGNANPTDPAIMARLPDPLPGEKPRKASPTNKPAGGPSISSDADIMDMVKKHEGVRNKPYKDSLGLWTVGVGHLIGDGKTLPPEWNREFSDKEIMNLFQKDYTHHKEAAQAIPGFNNLNTNGQAALIDLTFNMGPVWWKKWPTFTKQLSSGDIEGAAKNLEGSKWYGQVGSRAPKIVALLRAGTDNQKVAENNTPEIRSIQHLLNKKGANLDIDGEFGPLTKKSINKFLPKAPTGLAPEPDKTTAVQGKEIKELSSNKLGQYKKAASADATSADKAGNFKKADKRFSGIVKATKKQFANDEKGVAEVSDGWIGNPAKWKEAVLQAHGPDVVFKNYSHPGQPGKRSVNAINADGKQVGVYQRHNKMGMVQPNMQGVAEGAPIVVAQAPIDVRNPKKAAQPVRYQGDIVPPTQPLSTEKRGVKGRPGQRPMPKHDVEEVKKKGADGKACWKGYRYAGTENGKDKCVPVSEDVEKIMGALIESILRK